MIFNYTLMKMANLSPTKHKNMSSIAEVCDMLGQTFLTSLVGNHCATGGLQVNSTPDYNLSSVPAQGEYNIADQTSGGLSCRVQITFMCIQYCEA